MTWRVKLRAQKDAQKQLARTSLSASFLFQLTRRISRETQQVFDWLISILISAKMSPTVVFHSVGEVRASGKGRKIMSALALAVLFNRMFKVNKLPVFT